MIERVRKYLCIVTHFKMDMCPLFSYGMTRVKRTRSGTNLVLYGASMKTSCQKHYVQCGTCHRKVFTEGNVSQESSSSVTCITESVRRHITYHFRTWTVPNDYFWTRFRRIFTLRKVSICKHVASKCVRHVNLASVKILVTMIRGNWKTCWVKIGTLNPSGMCHYGDVSYALSYSIFVLSLSTCPIKFRVMFDVYMCWRLTWKFSKCCCPV